MTFLIIFLAIALQIFLTIKKVSPFLSLLIVAILTGLCLGMEPTALILSLEKGVGNTLGGKGLLLVICLGAAFGKILEVGGRCRTNFNNADKWFWQKKYSMGCFTYGFFDRYSSVL